MLDTVPDGENALPAGSRVGVDDRVRGGEFGADAEWGTMM
jgi:hypothetical protein